MGFSPATQLLTARNWMAQNSVHDPALTPWFAALANRQFARCNVICLGDSITEGQAASTFDNAWRSRLRDMLRSTFPTPGVAGGGRGYLNLTGTGELSFVWPSTISGAPPGVSTGPKGSGLQFNQAGHQVVYNLTGDFADIMWEQVPLGGTFSWKVDAGAATNVSTNGGSTVDGKLTRIALGGGAHTLTLAWVSGTLNIDGVIEYNGDSAAGLQVHDCGHYGWQTSSWLGVSPWNAIAALNPALVIITLGVNDQFLNVVPATYGANLASIISNIRGALSAPFPSFVLNMLPARTGQAGFTYPWQQYVNAAWNVAGADSSGIGGASLVSVMDYTQGNRMPGADIDIYTLWQPADLVHPSNKGHQLLADYMTWYLTQ